MGAEATIYTSGFEVMGGGCDAGKPGGRVMYCKVEDLLTLSSFLLSSLAIACSE